MVDPPRQIAWRTIPTPLFVDSSDWRVTLEPAGAGTQIVQTFEVTRCPRWWEWIVTRFIPRHIDRGAALTDDLRRIAAVAADDVGRRNGHRARRDRRGGQVGGSLGGMGAEEHLAACGEPGDPAALAGGCSAT